MYGNLNYLDDAGYLFHNKDDLLKEFNKHGDVDDVVDGCVMDAQSKTCKKRKAVTPTKNVS